MNEMAKYMAENQSPPEGKKMSPAQKAILFTAETLFPFAVGLGEQNNSLSTSLFPNKKARIVLGALGDIAGYTFGLMTVATKDAISGDPVFPMYVRIGIPLLLAFPHLKGVARLLDPTRKKLPPENPK